MKKFSYYILVAAVAFGLTACDEKQKDVVDDVTDGVQMTMRSSSIEEGATVQPVDSVTINFNNLVGIDSSKTATLNGQSVKAYVNPADGTQLVVPVSTEFNKEYTLVIPNGMVYRRDNQSVTFGGLTLHFNTNYGLDKSKVATALTNPNATPEAVALYKELLDNYGSVMYSGAMGGVAWETGYTDYINNNNGGAGYPKVVGFDYIHLAYSPANWIDYGDIKPVQDVWNIGSIPAITWHWNVPEDMNNVLSSNVTVMPENWSASIIIPATSFKLATEGTVVTVNISDVASNAQGSLKGGDWVGLVDGDGTSFEYFDLASGSVNNNVSITSNAITMTLSPALLAKVKEGGLIVSGHDYTVQSVTFNSVVYDITRLNAQSQNFSAVKALTPGTVENQIMTADVDKLAGYLKLLQDANIPVLFRPLHEAAGDYVWGAWFWWGKDGVDATKQLWSYLRDKLEGEYGINNLIWVWTVQTSAQGQPADVATIRNAYPGDDLVDMVGTDLYPAQPLSDQTDQFNLVNNVVDGKKIVCLSEVGNLIDPEAAAANKALWSYFMNWYDYSPRANENEPAVYGFGQWNSQSVKFGGVSYSNPWAAVANNRYVINR